MSVFTAGTHLYFQWNDERWDFKDLAPIVRYKHDFQNKVTMFSIGDVAIEYPAWWSNDPAFDPSEPERDEHEDFFAYVANLAHDETLQRTLINRWDKISVTT